MITEQTLSKYHVKRASVASKAKGYSTGQGPAVKYAQKTRWIEHKISLFDRLCSFVNVINWFRDLQFHVEHVSDVDRKKMRLEMNLKIKISNFLCKKFFFLLQNV